MAIDVPRLRPWPKGWYYAGPEKAVGRHPLPVTLFDRRLVIFRGTGSAYGAVGSRCAHFGVDLGSARVCGGRLKCPFHGWEFDTGGVCRHRHSPLVRPGPTDLPAWPVEARHDGLFIYNGATPDYPLPFYPATDPGEFVGTRAVTFFAAAPWYMIAANGLDAAHFEAVHGRRIRKPIAFTEVSPWESRVDAELAIVGTGPADRLLRRVMGADVSFTAHLFGGNVLLFDVRYGRTRVRHGVFIQPTGPGALRADIIPYFRPGAADRLLPGALAAKALVKRWLIRAFFGPEARSLTGLDFNLQSRTEADEGMARMLRWIGRTQSVEGGATAGDAARGLRQGAARAQSDQETIPGCPRIQTEFLAEVD